MRSKQTLARRVSHYAIHLIRSLTVQHKNSKGCEMIGLVRLSLLTTFLIKEEYSELVVETIETNTFIGTKYSVHIPQ